MDKKEIKGLFPLLIYTFEKEEEIYSLFDYHDFDQENVKGKDSPLSGGKNLYEFIVALLDGDFSEEPTPQQWEKIYSKTELIVDLVQGEIKKDLQGISKVQNMEGMKDWVTHSSVLSGILDKYSQFRLPREELAHRTLNPHLGERVFNDVMMTKYVGMGFLSLIALQLGTWTTKFVLPSWAPYGRVVLNSVEPYMKSFIRSALSIWGGYIVWDSFKFFQIEQTFWDEMKQRSQEAAYESGLLITSDDSDELESQRKARTKEFWFSRSFDAVFLVGLPAAIVGWRLLAPRHYLKREGALAQLYEQVGFPKGEHSPSEGFIHEVYRTHMAQLRKQYDRKVWTLKGSFDGTLHPENPAQSEVLMEKLRALTQNFHRQQTSVTEAKKKLLKVITRTSKKWERFFNLYRFDLERLNFKESHFNMEKFGEIRKEWKVKREEGKISDEDWGEIEVSLRRLDDLFVQKSSAYLQGGPIHRAILMRAVYGESAVAKAQKDALFGLQQEGPKPKVSEGWFYEVLKVKTSSGEEVELILPREGLFRLQEMGTKTKGKSKK